MKKYTPQQNQPTGNPQARPSRTYEDWQADQQADERTPEERGIAHRLNRDVATSCRSHYYNGASDRTCD